MLRWNLTDIKEGRRMGLLFQAMTRHPGIRVVIPMQYGVRHSDTIRKVQIRPIFFLLAYPAQNAPK